MEKKPTKEQLEQARLKIEKENKKDNAKRIVALLLSMFYSEWFWV